GPLDPGPAEDQARCPDDSDGAHTGAVAVGLGVPPHTQVADWRPQSGAPAIARQTVTFWYRALWQPPQSATPGTIRRSMPRRPASGAGSRRSITSGSA